MYDEGKEKVEKNLDIVKLLKNSLHNTAAINAKVMDLKLHESILRSEHVIIDMDGEISFADDRKGTI